MTPSPPLRPRTHRAHRASSPAEAESIGSDAGLPHRLVLPRGVVAVDLEMVTARIAGLGVTRVSYGQAVTVHTEDLEDLFIGFTLRGRAEMSSGTRPASTVEVGSAVVFRVGEPAHVSMSEDCAILSVNVPVRTVETELEHLLGRALTRPLELGFELDLTGDLGQTWEPLLRLLIEELRRPTSLTQHPVAARRIQALVIDALLLGHVHNYREQLDTALTTPTTAVGRAVRLIESAPGDEWSTARLAEEVHLSARALQAGFRRDLGMAPMDYVRKARLSRIRVALTDASPGRTTVQALAQAHGFGHLGRFAAAYRERYGESPVETLRRPTLS